jgi:hypothetical protein
MPYMQQTAQVLNEVSGRGLPGPAHQLVTELVDQLGR